MTQTPEDIRAELDKIVAGPFDMTTPRLVRIIENLLERVERLEKKHSHAHPGTSLRYREPNK